MRMPVTTGLGKIAALVILSTLILAFRATAPAAAVSGTFTLTYVNPSVANGTNASGAAIFISTATGSNRNTGSGSYMAGAKVLNVDTAAMVNGNGTHTGHATLSESGGTIVKKFVGKVTTVMVKGRPESTFKGAWTVTRGTGKYAGSTGSGTYTGRFESGTRYTVQWKGNVSM